MNLAKAEQIKGWMSSVELAFLAEQARVAEFILEFGSYHGRSTRALADNTPGVVFAVDPWDGMYPDNNGNITNLIEEASIEDFHRNLDDHILTGRVIPVRMFSHEFYRSPLARDLKFNFIFIDGDHRYETVKQDISIALSLIKPNGVIAGHDYTHSDWPGVKKAVDELLGPISYIDSIWYTRVS